MINVAIFNYNGKEELILLGVKGRNVFDDRTI